MKYQTTNTWRCIWTISWPVLAYLSISMMAEALMQRPDQNIGNSGQLKIMLLSAVLTSLILGIFYNKNVRSCQAPQDKPASLVWWIAVTGFGSCICLNTLIAWIGGFTDTYLDNVNWFYQCPFYLQVLSVGIFVPLAEELSFRGLGYLRIRQQMSQAWAILISAIFFALYHGNLAQGMYAFILGLVLAWLCEQYLAVWPAVWLHMAANLSSIVLSNFERGRSINQVPPWLLLPVSAGVMMSGIYKIREDVKKREIVIDSNSVL